MTEALQAPRELRLPAPGGVAAVRLEQVGVRFDFDGLGRVVTPTLRHIRRVRATAWGLADVGLRIDAGEAVAVVGPTGSGKTTLLRVIAGVLPPDAGSAEVRGGIGSLLATGAGLQMLLTGRENAELLGVLAGLTLAETRERIDFVAERSRLGDAFDRPVHTYSEGMRARLGFAVIQLTEPDILLLDEVFEALDHEFRAIVERWAQALRSRGGIVVAAGHDHLALGRMCPRALWLSEGRVQDDGSFNEVIGAYRASGAREAAST
jgi:ABC-type polysaccharide/polyol phosphate transport system ATPase subunit